MDALTSSIVINLELHANPKSRAQSDADSAFDRRLRGFNEVCEVFQWDRVFPSVHPTQKYINVFNSFLDGGKLTPRGDID
jgi:hypothetical protein